MLEEIATEFTVNRADVAPEGTLTVAGTVPSGVLDESETTSPKGPAGPDSWTVPVEPVPPTTEAGAALTLDTAGGFTTKVVCAVTVVWIAFVYVAVIVAVVCVLTPVVVIGNVANIAP